MKIYYIQAFYKKLPLKTGGYQIDDYVKVTVEAETEKEALFKAKKVIKRPLYRVFEVFEKTNDQTLHEDTMMANLEIQSRLLKLLK